MHDTKCPKCGTDTAPGGACPGCGQANGNGVSKPKWVKPPPPPELAHMVFEPTPPEMREELLRTFDEGEWLAAVREIERTGGYQLEDFIEEIERIANGGSEPPTPYRVEYSGAVLQRHRLLAAQATARGDGPAFAAALKEFDRLLRLYPQFGDPQIDLTAATGIIYNGIVRPLAMRYGVYEAHRLVLVVAQPILLPMDKPEDGAPE